MRSSFRTAHVHSHLSTFILNIRRETNFSHWKKMGREGERFLPWLQQKTGCEISTVLSVGVSSHGSYISSLGNIEGHISDFLNHDGSSEAELLNDDINEISEVAADRDYTSGEQVFIRYGKFPNAILVMDFGFTLPCNYHDQVTVWMNVPDHDPLYRSKANLLHKHCLSTNLEGRPSQNSKSSFVIREVKSPKGKGKGIPQALRAYARILSVTSHAELNALEIEATKTDGRLARRPLKNIECENQAHHLLVSQLSHMVHSHAAAIKGFESTYTCSPDVSTQSSIRRKMAVDLLNGELGVLKSASSWLTNYCASLSSSVT